MAEITVESISSLLNEAERLSGELGISQPWYRGVPNKVYSLIPSVFRLECYANAEVTFVNEFRSRAVSRYRTCPPNKDYVAWLMLMRHYDLPTRLLDWTESLQVSAFFAVKGLKKTAAEVDVDKQSENRADAEIWILHPGRFNRIFGAKSEGLLSIEDREVRFLAAGAFRDTDGFPDRPPPDQKHVAFVGQENDPRMKAQRSMFTIHALKSDLRQHPNANEFLRSIVIQNANKEKLLNELTSLGFLEMNLFPDLPHLVEWLIEERLRGLCYIY